MDPDTGDVIQRALTGNLPPSDDVAAQLQIAYERNLYVDEGALADYIPILAEADPTAFGLTVVELDGNTHQAGDAGQLFSIQSISKAFVYALACEEHGHDRIQRRIGVNNTGLPFNSVVAIELNAGHPMNPMVNAGAIATTALIPGEAPDAQWQFILDGLARFAGRTLQIDETVYRCEVATNQRNQAIGRLLESYGRIDQDPLAAVDLYTKQCSLLVNAYDLAVMGATLADGGVNPITGKRAVSEEVCRDTLAVLAACGMYENSGRWLFEIGLPGKSGVSGGIVTVAPGKAGVGAYSPLLDRAGNSVRGARATAFLARSLGLNVFASSVQMPADNAEPD